MDDTSQTLRMVTKKKTAHHDSLTMFNHGQSRYVTRHTQQDSRINETAFQSVHQASSSYYGENSKTSSCRFIPKYRQLQDLTLPLDGRRRTSADNNPWVYRSWHPQRSLAMTIRHAGKSQYFCFPSTLVQIAPHLHRVQKCQVTWGNQCFWYNHIPM